MAGRKGHYQDCSEYLGRRFGSWTVIGTGYSDSKLAQAFVTRCACGNYGRVPKANLEKGNSTQCSGCRTRAGDRNPRWAGYKDIPQHTYSIMRKAAEVRGIVVEIAIEDLQAQWEKQGGICALTGLPLRIGSLKTGRVASVDRIDGKRGYTKDNIQWVHKDVNLMKNKFDEDYFYDMCRRVVEHKKAA